MCVVVISRSWLKLSGSEHDLTSKPAWVLRLARSAGARGLGAIVAMLDVPVAVVVLGGLRHPEFAGELLERAALVNDALPEREFPGAAGRERARLVEAALAVLENAAAGESGLNDAVLDHVEAGLGGEGPEEDGNRARGPCPRPCSW